MPRASRARNSTIEPTSRVLSFHTSYACRHSGACCNAGWIEPLETGACRFFESNAAGSCTIHRAHGHDALPHACQQFPRVTTRSPLGISLTLSAFCPTAASLLFDEAPFAITTMNDGRRYEGLDATNVLPPLLREGMLMDWNAVARWEDLAVATLSDHRDDVGTALQIIETASAEVRRTWTPGEATLSEALAEAFTRARAVDMSGATALKDRRRDRSLARPQPDGAQDISADRARQTTLAPAVARYFAGHAFACWAMYDGRGIAGALEHLRVVKVTLNEESARLAVEAGRALDADLLKEAFRQADLRLRHTLQS